MTGAERFVSLPEQGLTRIVIAGGFPFVSEGVIGIKMNDQYKAHQHKRIINHNINSRRRPLLLGRQWHIEHDLLRHVGRAENTRGMLEKTEEIQLRDSGLEGS